MIKHKPIPRANVLIDRVEYKCNGQGILELPRVYKQFNPIEEEIKEEIKDIKEWTKKQKKQSQQEV